MEREALVSKLSLVAPALSSKDIIAVLSCVCFDGATVTAYDDVVAIQAPLEMDIKCGVRGSTLLGFLNVCKSSEVTLEKRKDCVYVKAGKADLKLPFVEPADFVFKVPADEAVVLPTTEDFINGVASMLESMGVDTSHPWRLGVSVEFSAEGATLFTNNNMHVGCRQFVPMDTVPKALRDRFYTLHPQFITLLVNMAKKDWPKTIEFGSAWACARFESGAVLYVRLIEQTDQKNHHAVFRAAKAEFAKYKGQPFPKGFERTLQRSLVVLEGLNDRVCQFTVSGGSLASEAKSMFGEAKDVSVLAGHVDAVSISFPDIMLKAMPGCDSVAFSPKGVVFTGPNRVALVRAQAKVG
jgi:hypothetical protein